MTRQEHLIQILGEEGGEINGRCSKALRFSLNEIQPGQHLTNAERIMEEFAHVVAMVEMCQFEGLLPEIDTFEIKRKKEKVEQFLLYSKEMGTLTESVPTLENLEVLPDPVQDSPILDWVRPCPYCQGSPNSFDPFTDDHRCATCNGSGFLLGPKTDDPEVSTDPVPSSLDSRTPCYYCKGVPGIKDPFGENGDLCPVCNGTGWIK